MCGQSHHRYGARRQKIIESDKLRIWQIEPGLDQGSDLPHHRIVSEASD